MAVLTALLVILATLVGYLIYKAHKINQTWKERGIPHKKPLLFIGNSLNTVLGRGGPLTINRQEVLNLFPNAPLVGYYDFVSPRLIVKDLELVERVLIKDFSYFTQRPMGVDDEKFPEISNLSNMTGKKWKSLRNKMIPVFTTGKLRMMFEQLSKLTEGLLESINSKDEKEIKGISIKDNFNRYSMDIIGAIAFGIEIGMLGNGNQEFAKMGKKLFDWRFSARFMLMLNFPNFCKKFGISINTPSVVEYYTGIVRQTIAQREASGIKRNDFIDLMMTLKEKGFLELDKEEGDEYLDMVDNSLPDNEKVEITETLILSNAFLFIMAGFDTLSNLLTMFCYDLSQNIHAQDKLREELRKSLASKNGVFSYDVIRDAPYLEMCVKETMRMHTFIGVLLRECTKEYTFPGTNVTVKPGDAVEIPSYCIHNDPEIYPEPERFIPERFAPEMSRPSCSWLPFGDGPRVCIAMRFVMVEAKVAITRLLLNYEVRLSSQTKLPVRLAPRAILFRTENPVYFDLKKIS